MSARPRRSVAGIPAVDAHRRHARRGVLRAEDAWRLLSDNATWEATKATLPRPPRKPGIVIPARHRRRIRVRNRNPALDQLRRPKVLDLRRRLDAEYERLGAEDAALEVLEELLEASADEWATERGGPWGEHVQHRALDLQGAAVESLTRMAVCEDGENEDEWADREPELPLESLDREPRSDGSPPCERGEIPEE